MDASSWLFVRLYLQCDPLLVVQTLLHLVLSDRQSLFQDGHGLWTQYNHKTLSYMYDYLVPVWHYIWYLCGTIWYLCGTCVVPVWNYTWYLCGTIWSLCGNHLVQIGRAHV